MPGTHGVPSVTLSRRQILGFGATLLSAGCSSTDVPGREDCTSGFHVSGERFDPSDDLIVELDADGQAIVMEAVETGSAERTTYSQEPLRGGIFVQQNGAFYETDVSTTETESVTAHRLRLEWEKGQTAPEDATVVKFSDLPDDDKKALELAVYGSDERKERPTESMSIEDFPAPYPDGSESSKLVGNDVTWVRWKDRVYRVEVTGSATQERRTFRYEMERVATRTEDFRTFVASRYRINLTGLPADEREIVAQAFDDRYEECTPSSDALESLQNRLPDNQRLPHPADGWYVRFEGGDYRLSIMQWVQ